LLDREEMIIMQRKITSRVSLILTLFLMAAGLRCACAANVMNYGADGMDYYRFTNPSMAATKASGFSTLITFAMHVNPDGTLLIGGDVACTNGVYTGLTNWNSLIATLKTPPTTVTRYEVCVGGYTDTSFDNIKSLVASQGTGSSSILYKNFQAMKNAVPGIDAINDDEEQTYDLNSATSFANMLGSLGFKFTMAPYQSQSFWVNLKNNITNCDYVYLQCYEGGAGNDPGQWNSAFGHGVVVIPGQESNTAYETNFHNWYLETGVQGGFYYPDVVFSGTYWSADVFEACGIVPTTPTGVTTTPGGGQVILSWNTAPGAMSYNVKRSAGSGGETTIASISATANNWPASNEYADTGRTSGTTYYYKVSAVNTNGASPDSAEVSGTPQAGIINNFSFEFDATAPGTALASVPTGWTAFNPERADYIGSENPSSSEYSVNNPLAPPADGNQDCWINNDAGHTNSGIYQDVGALQTNTIYALTVAIGSRADRMNSPGNISLINGTNNTGTVLATCGGLPAATNTWQNYTTSFTTGASVSGDLTIMLSVLGAGTIQADFDNVRLTTTPVPVTPPTSVSVNNFSFENGAKTGGSGQSIPVQWSDFNNANYSGVGNGGWTDHNPLDPTADSNNCFQINEGSGGPTGGIYQDVGPLQPNTVYTLKVALGRRNDFTAGSGLGSPGIISLINGTSNTGILLVANSGIPATPGVFQDYTATYITGPSVSGDLTIELSVVGASTYQANFDNVRLTKAAITFNAPIFGAPKVSGGNLILTGAGGTPNAGYTWLVTTNLTTPINWTTNSTGTLDGAGSFSNAIPINASQRASFFRLRMP
jgi:hypothetical protein